MSVVIFMEGGCVGKGSSPKNTECRKGIHELLKNCGFSGRLPVVHACGGRADAFREFKNELRGSRRFDFVILWIDSEDAVADIEKTWAHLKARPDDNWDRPNGATDDQVLLMTTCMETLIVADRTALLEHYKSTLQVSALPPLENLEQRQRHDVQDMLVHATRDCSNRYAKGKRSFEVLGKLNPDTLEKLESFKRTRRILEAKL